MIERNENWCITELTQKGKTSKIKMAIHNYRKPDK